MGRAMRTPVPLGAIAAALVIWLGAVLGVGATGMPDDATPPAAEAVAAAPAPQAPAAVQPLKPGYVGEAACLECHETEGKGYHGSAHARPKNLRAPAARETCESCHGPGQKHVEADGDGFIKNPARMKPREASEMCVSCHDRGEHALWAGGKHDSRNMSCVSCHSVHDAKSETAQLKKATEQETCVQCHRTQVNKLHRSSHMPLREGKMECSTCHNAHGSQNVKMLKEGTTVNESCVSCHAEKRGPFLWEHAAGRENCVTCHDPHGSNNERMLVAKGAMLCQRCHVHSRHPATIYDNTQFNVTRSNRVVGRACVNCHSAIHGSNHPTSGKVFVR